MGDKENKETEKKIEIIEEYYKKFSRELLHFVFYLTKDYSLSCDILQETFVNFIKNFYKTEFSGEEKVRFYLIKSAKNVLINYKKRTKKVVNKQVEKLDQLFPVQKEKHDTDLEKQEKVMELLEILEFEEKSLILMRFFLSLSLEEIASLKNKSVSSISRDIDKIVNKLYHHAKNMKML